MWGFISHLCPNYVLLSLLSGKLSIVDLGAGTGTHAPQEAGDAA